MRWRLFPLLLLTIGWLAGCSVTGPHRDISGEVPAQKAAAEIPEAQLLDVWIELFDAGTLPGDKDDASGLSMDIRQAESRYMPVLLRDSMEKTGYWGAVRVVPRDTEGGEVVVRGAILASDGERLELRITALDATGREWFSRIYESAKVAASAYQPGVQPPVEPFQSVYYTIANDLASFRDKLTVGEITTIRRVAQLRFAADIAPDAYAGYLQHDDQGHYSITHLPAGNDPMYRRVLAIRERDFLLVDTLNGNFDNFYREMQQPYSDWRRTRSEEAASLHQIEQDALDIGGFEDVHRGRGGGDHVPAAQVVAAGLYPVGQDVVAVRGDQDLLHRQAHLHGVVAAQGVAEVAAGYGEIEVPWRIAGLFLLLRISVDIVEGLGDEPA